MENPTSNTLGLNLEKLKEEFEEKGIVRVAHFLSRSQADDLCEELKEIIEREGPTIGTGNIRQKDGSLASLSRHSEKFRNLAKDPRLLDILEVLMSPNIELTHTKAVSKSADAPWGSPWHQDAFYWKGGTKITVGLVLCDSTIENGCLQVVPGSHKKKLAHGSGKDFAYEVDPAEIDPADVEDVVLEAGGLFIFHDDLLHASRDNQTSETRWFYYATYADASKPDLHYPLYGQEQYVVRGELTAPRLEYPPVSSY